MGARRPAKPLRPKRRVTEVAFGAHANAGLRAHVSACRLSRMLVQKPKVCRLTAPAAPAGDVILRNYAIFIACFTLGILGATLAQLPDHRIARILGRAFRSRLQPETASHSEARFRDAVSVFEPSGKRGPFRGREMGHAFRSEQKPRLAMESGLKAQLMQLMVSANDPSAVVVRALPYPR